MTIVEFYDKAAIENMAGALLCTPDHVILVGDNGKKMEKSIGNYRTVLGRRGIQTAFSYRSVNKNNLTSILTALEQIVGENSNCIFDLTGGEDLYLVAVGMILQKYGETVKCHRFNFKNNSLADCDADGHLCSTRPFAISVEENIRIYGGELVCTEIDGIATYDWQFDEDFKADITAMWQINCKNPRLWNAQISSLGALNDLLNSGDELSFSFENKEISSLLPNFCRIEWIMDELEKAGLLQCRTESGRSVFTFKNRQIKRCLTVAGQILELVVAAHMRSLTDKDGQPLYNDVRVGAILNWDDTHEDGEIRTINEIDVLAMKGTIPVFISCKNGMFDVNELYKLNAVAEHFGAQYAKRVLIATELDKLGSRAEHIRARAEDMHIRIIDDVDQMPDSELDRILTSLWFN